ncbi:hypothetical protein [Comamonas guangdongensis]|uniref:Uncharacterized protein n=1 Tax=Comamonas guangdongensis TaxID=510515 RepID=A0ABV3ZRY5_9BURK
MDLGNAMPPPTDRKPGIALFLDGAAAQQPSTILASSEAHSLRSLRWFRAPSGALAFYLCGPPPRVFFSAQGVLMLYGTVPQPIDEDLVQRLREKGGL